MVPNMRATFTKDLKRVMELLFGTMEASTKGNSKTIILRVSGTTSGQMGENMRGHGKTTRCREGEFSFGLMAASMKGNTMLIRKKATDSFLGRTVDATRANGKTASKMGRADTEIRKECREAVHGSMERRSNGMIDLTDIFYLFSLINT